jgi:hypothetical protein
VCLMGVSGAKLPPPARSDAGYALAVKWGAGEMKNKRPDGCIIPKKVVLVFNKKIRKK